MKPVKLENKLVRLNCVSEDQFKEFLLKEIYKLYLKNGQNKPSANDAATITNELYRNLIRIWPGVKTLWIGDAFENGINGEYGEFANISYRLMIYWINKYRFSMDRKDFGIKEDPMPTKERANFVLDGLRKRNPGIGNIK